MAKKLPLSPSQKAYLERFQATVEARHSHPPGEADIQRILDDVQSPDENVRAKAVEQICPCRMPWEMFRPLRKVAKRLQHDPSALVRAYARHVEEDARLVEVAGAMLERAQEVEEALEDAAHRPDRRVNRRRVNR